MIQNWKRFIMKMTDKMQHNEASHGERTCKKLGYHIIDRYKKSLLQVKANLGKNLQFFLKIDCEKKNK